DSAGETRSDQRVVRVGYTALQSVVSAAEWQTVEKAVEVTITTQTLDSEPQVAEGVLKIYRLKEPAQVQRQQLAGPQYWRYSGDFDSTQISEEDLSNPNSWPLGDSVFERGFTTGTNGQAKAEVKPGVGVYRAIFETQDRFGKKVTAQAQIRVVDPAATKLAIKIPQLFDAPAWSVEPG